MCGFSADAGISQAKGENGISKLEPQSIRSGSAKSFYQTTERSEQNLGYSSPELNVNEPLPQENNILGCGLALE